MNTSDNFLAMKPDPPGSMGDEPIEKKKILRGKITLIQLQKVFEAISQPWHMW